MPRLTITVPEGTPQPYRFSLERQIVHFGRGDDNDIHIESGSISSEHAVMERIIGGYILKDLGSTNGIKLKGERVDKISLRNGQDIHLGDVVFGFELSDEELTALRLEDPTSQLPPLNEDPSKAKSDSSSVPTSPEIELKAEPKTEAKPQQAPAQDLPEKKPQPEPLPDIEPEPIREVAPQQQAAPQQQQVAPQQMGMAPADNGRFNKLIALLAAIAFLAGIAMHFQRKTDQSIFSALMKKMTGAQATESTSE